MKIISLAAESLVPVFGCSATNIDPRATDAPEETLAVRSGGTALLEAGFKPSVWFTDNKVLGKQDEQVVVIDLLRNPQDAEYRLVLGSDERLKGNDYPYYSAEQVVLQPLDKVQAGTATEDDGIEAMRVVVGGDDAVYFDVYYS